MATDYDFLPDTIQPLNHTSEVNQTLLGGLIQERKIDDDLLFQMLANGKSQKECAEYFGCSKSAISQRVSKITVVPRPAILDKLTPSQERFAFGIAEGKSQTQAVIDSYNTDNRESAAVQGSRLMSDPLMQECIKVIMETEGLTRRKMVRRLSEHVDSRDAQASLRAIDIGLKLTDSYPAEKKVNVNFTAVIPVDLAKYRNR